ncbi:MAG: altronate dehydratase family protein [Chloroflexota bacterium]
MSIHPIQMAQVASGSADLRDVAMHLNPADDVAIATVTLGPGLIITFAGKHFFVHRTIPVGHKVALTHRREGEPVHRYGHIIGFATLPIEPGDHVHSHNLGVGALEHDYAFGQLVHPAARAPEGTSRTFAGFRRADGRTGTRNYIAIISSVNCSASVSRYIADHFRGDALKKYPNVDGVIALTHKGGCGAHYGGREVDLLQRTLAGFARHPNVGGYILMGLGCEVNQIPDMVEQQHLANPTSLVIQDVGGLVESVEAGIRAVEHILPRVNDCHRERTPVSELVVALQCGGSDAWSGITANPALGKAVDLLVAHGGTAVLGETTEVYGAEHLLTRRAISEEVGQKLLDRIRWWERYTAMNGAEIDNNPTPGNKLGGLTTIYEKSLGAIAKSGTTPMTDVVEYAETVRTRGFIHMDTPGYDPVSVTGQVAGGCTLVVFTTGRGSVFGCRPVPTIKVATNTPLFEKMRNDMDLNAGRILDGATLDEVGAEMFDLMIDVASGVATRSERHGIGEEEFNPCILGATL